MYTGSLCPACSSGYWIWVRLTDRQTEKVHGDSQVFSGVFTLFSAMFVFVVPDLSRPEGWTQFRAPFLVEKLNLLYFYLQYVYKSNRISAVKCVWIYTLYVSCSTVISGMIHVNRFFFFLSRFVLILFTSLWQEAAIHQVQTSRHINRFSQSPAGPINKAPDPHWPLPLRNLSSSLCSTARLHWHAQLPL